MIGRKSRRALFGILALAAGVAGLPSTGCSSAPLDPVLPRETRRPQDLGVTIESPAHWIAFPESVGTPTASLVLGDHCLVLTDDGQRWLVTPSNGAHPCDGVGYASGSPTLESLVSAQKVGDDFRFIAEGGVVYTSHDPIGPFTRAARAPTFLRAIASRGGTTTAIDETGAVYSFDGSWHKGTLPAGLSGVDVGADDHGRALMIAAPETLLVSNDAGRSFTPVPGATTVPRIGAYRVGLTSTGALAARGLSSTLVLGETGVTKTDGSILDAAATSAVVQPATGPHAGLVADQVAALDGGRYFELSEQGEPKARWKLSSGLLGKTPTVVGLDGRDECENLKIAARGRELVLACLKSNEERGDLEAQLFSSKDLGATFEPLTTVWAQTFADVSFALGGDGSVLMLGVCKDVEDEADADKSAADKRAAGKSAAGKPVRATQVKPPERTGSRTSGCDPHGAVLVRREAKGVSVVQGSAPHLQDGTGRAPALSVDGKTAFFVGQSKKEGRSAIFVSRDGGHSYVARALESQEGGGDGDEEGYDAPPPGNRALELHEGARITFDESGTIGLVVDTQSGSAYATLDSEGRVVNVSPAPEYGAQIGGSGSRAIAIAYGQNDGVLRAWESLDAGSTWSEIATTQAVTRFLDRGESIIACSMAGCILGNELLRLGWEGQAETPFDAPEDVAQAIEPQLSAPIVCQLTAKTEWTPMAGRGDDTGDPRLPRLRELARGKTLWALASRDDDSGAIDLFSAAYADKSAPSEPPTRKNLLPARSGKGRVVTTLSPQNEGFAAMRASVPTQKTGALDLGKPVDNVELAWVNFFTGTNGRRTVKLDGAWSANLAGASDFRPAMLTVAGPGVVAAVDLHRKAMFFDAGGKATPFDYPAWDEIITDHGPITHSDAAWLGGIGFGVGMVDRAPNGSVIVLARRAPSGSGWVSEAATLARSGAELEWMYAGDRSGFVTYASDSTGVLPMTATGWLLENDGTLGPAIDLPTLADIPDKPKACSAEQRKTTPRAVSPHFGRSGLWLQPAGRRVVLLSDINAGAPTGASAATSFAASEPVWMLTDGAVLQGTKQDPCVSAFRASSTRSGAIAILSGDLERSWVLRRSAGQVTPKGGAKGTGRWVSRLEAHPMTCRIQTDLALPYEVISRAGQRMADDQP